MAESTENVCRGCGKPLPSETVLCSSCGARLAMGILAESDRDHRGDVVLAVLTFGVTHVGLYVLAGLEQFTLAAMLWRSFFLGLPLAAVMWKWHRLMWETEADYGQLWHTYWLAQIATWFGSLAFVLALYAFVPAALAAWRLIFF